jgi:hypothetical protein
MELQLRRSCLRSPNISNRTAHKPSMKLPLTSEFGFRQGPLQQAVAAGHFLCFECVMYERLGRAPTIKSTRQQSARCHRVPAESQRGEGCTLVSRQSTPYRCESAVAVTIITRNAPKTAGATLSELPPRDAARPGRLSHQTGQDPCASAQD